MGVQCDTELLGEVQRDVVVTLIDLLLQLFLIDSPLDWCFIVLLLHLAMGPLRGLFLLLADKLLEHCFWLVDVDLEDLDRVVRVQDKQEVPLPLVRQLKSSVVAIAAEVCHANE